MINGAIAGGLVALMFEYLAKPRLEARKERILRAVRNRDELLGHLIAIGVVARQLATDTPKDLAPGVREGFLLEQQRAYQRLNETTHVLYDRMGDLAGSYAWLPRDLIIRYMIVMRGLLMSDRTRHAKAKETSAITEPLAGYLTLVPLWAPWRNIRRAKALLEANAKIAKLGGYEELAVRLPRIHHKGKVGDDAPSNRG